MKKIATPVSTLFNKRENINKIIKYSYCLEGRENLYTLSINNIEI